MRGLRRGLFIATLLAGFSAEDVWADTSNPGFRSGIAALSETTTKRNTYSATGNDSKEIAVVHVVRQSLPEFLRQVAQREGYKASISGKVSGLVQGQRFPMGIPNIMPRLAEAYELIWFSQNQFLHVIARSEAIKKTIQVGDMRPERLLRTMKLSGISIGNHELSFVRSQGSVLLSGSNLMISTIEQLVKESAPELVAPKSDLFYEGEGHDVQK